jgi:cytochrome c556
MPRAVVLAILAAGCDGAGAPSAAPTPREEQFRGFVRAMKAMDLQYENLRADLMERKPPEEARRRIASIRAGAAQASRLPYRASEAENRDLSFEFSRFLDAAAGLEGAAWSGEEGLAAWKRLGTACASCHNLYRVDQ